ncbi:MAG: 4-(cytidine 5'-diphospho)-2-C-methyl-D-erythritol kinase [Rectinemataceae bacterium]|nr:4-(cytidine 5'-diphospho)-2-C-methyl-D-erythritol kinase [Rectinemataceae bacterium]
MKTEFKVEAFAKINIGLEIGAPLQDGYHPILGIFHSVGISDLLYCAKGEGSEIRVEGAFDCPPQATTIYRAAQLFLEHFKIRGGLVVRVEKGIPVMAGMGGGSADAAAVLLALSRLYDVTLTDAELSTVATTIGADVSFFIKGGAAVVSGRGDIIEPIPARRDFGILVVYPGFGVSTKWAYAALDAFREGPGKVQSIQDGRDAAMKKKILCRSFAGEIKTWDFYNSFSPMLHSAFPVYDTLQTMMKEAGAQYVSITGSGSSMYGIFRTMSEASEAKEKLQASLTKHNATKTLYGMALHAMKPLETSLLLG